jgi:hypothetical protein
MIGTSDEKAGTRDAGRGTRVTPLTAGCFVSIVSFEGGYTHILPRFSNFAHHVPRHASQGF